MPEGCNDGHALLRALGAPAADVPAILSSLRGPWAVVYWQAHTDILWVGRDPLGEPPRTSAETNFIRHFANAYTPEGQVPWELPSRT